MIINHLLVASKDWSESRGLLHRTQAYGLNLDVMAAAGEASIPEVETMQFNKGSEGGYKLITSGAHLYNRPIVSCEAGVYINRAFMTTPQKLKLTIDKVLSCGVNQIIWHGTPYQYFPESYPKEGWYPFYNSSLGVNFSSNLNESSPFWKYMSHINLYAQRAQYVLRSGKANADVLIYYPFLNYSDESYNPNEIFLNGYMKDVEPYLDAENVTASFNNKIETEWLDEIWPLVNELNSKGITWDWVNDESIQAMSVRKDKKLNIRGNTYESIILFDLPYIQLKSAERLDNLSKSGANILVVGDLPKIQPSYHNFETNDKLTASIMQKVIQSPSSIHIKNINAISHWQNKLNIPIINQSNYSFLRQTRRIMDDGSIAQFYWNADDQWNKATIGLSENYKYAYWLNPEDGTIIKAEKKGNSTEYTFPPYGTIFLYLTNSEIENTTQITKNIFSPYQSKALLEIEKWNIQSDTIIIKNCKLFDWKNNDELKYSASEGIYTSNFTIDEIDSKSSYFIDLGKVYYSAELSINGELGGKALYMPFVFDITPYIKKGNNSLEVRVTPTKYNEFVGEANNDNRLYKKLKNTELMSEGLIGSVIIYEQKNK